MADDDAGYYVLPEEAVKFLPAEWQAHFEAMADDGRAVLTLADRELGKLSRISKSFSTLVTLKHIQQRLAAYQFAAEMDAFLELDMLTTAFVVTYVRLQQGGAGSGFSRDALPEHLRQAHDHIIELRNKRFAHNDEHPSVANAMEIGFDGERFALKFELTLGFHIGGANEWHELVKFIDAMMFDRIQKLLTTLKEKTGREWTFPEGPPPEA